MVKSVAKPDTKTTATIRAKENEAPAPPRRGSASEDNVSGRSTPQPATGPTTLKKQDSKSGAKKDKATSDIFKSFAKAKSKPKEAEKSKESTPAPVEDGKYSFDYSLHCKTNISRTNARHVGR